MKIKKGSMGRPCPGFEIEIIDGIDFKVKKYFDIPINNWKLENLAPSINRATKLCLNINQTKS